MPRHLKPLALSATVIVASGAEGNAMSPVCSLGLAEHRMHALEFSEACSADAALVGRTVSSPRRRANLCAFRKRATSNERKEAR